MRRGLLFQFVQVVVGVHGVGGLEGFKVGVRAVLVVLECQLAEMLVDICLTCGKVLAVTPDCCLGKDE